MKTEMDIELLLRWAFRDELSKRQLSAAEGIWDRIDEIAQRGGIDDRGHGSAQRYAHFGLPDPDAELIGQAVTALEDTVIDWPRSFNTIAAELSGLISVNDMARRDGPKRAPRAGWGEAGAKAVKAFWGEAPRRHHQRDVLMVGGLRTAALVTMHAIQGTRPEWQEDPPEPSMIPAVKGQHAMIIGECRGRNLYSTGAYCPLKWEPSPLSIVSSRAEYIAWHAGLVQLASTLQLAKFAALHPKAPQTPWIDKSEPRSEVKSVMPTPSNNASAWGTLPLCPSRGRMGPPLRIKKAGPVSYPLNAERA